MADSAAPKAVLTLLNDLFNGTGPAGSLILNPGDPGLLKPLDKLSAEQASAIPPGGDSTIAAHVEHLRFGLNLLNRWARGENDVFANATFSASWEHATVSAEEWAARREALASEARAWCQAADHPIALDGPGIDVLIASVVHLAYHIGAIRQINGLLRGPAARD